MKDFLSERLIPVAVMAVMKTLHDAGYNAYLVGACLRDCLLGLQPLEWEVATSAPPALLDAFFERVVPVGDKPEHLVYSGDLSVRVAGTDRAASGEGHGRQAGVTAVIQSQGFTVNALAWDPFSGELIDPWKTAGLLKAGIGIIQTAGAPAGVFREEPLRLLEAVYLMKRFDDAGCEWRLEPATGEALRLSSSAIREVPPGKIRPWLNRIITGKRPDIYFEEMKKGGLLDFILPELAATCGIMQNDYHIKDVFGHTLLVLKEIRPELHLRWAALLHDIGKPRCISFEDGTIHFYGHQAIGSSMAYQILKRLGFDRDFIKRVAFLVHRHMYPYPKTRKAIRRFINRIGLRSLADLLELRRADILGGKYKNLSRLEHFQREIEAVLWELPPFSLRDLAVDGYDVMEALGVKPGPVVGRALRFLFERVLEDPDLNDREELLKLLKEEFLPAAAGESSSPGRTGAPAAARAAPSE